MRFDPRDVERLGSPGEARPLRSDRAADATRVDARLLAAPYIGRRAQELLERSGWNFADATGNVRIAIERPPLFVRLVGQAKSPYREARPLRTLKGPVAGRLVRALADFRPPFGIRELAKRTSTSPAMASRVVAMLSRDAITTRNEAGAVVGVDWKALIERWCEEYSFVRSNRLARFLALRGPEQLMERLQRTRLDYVITGNLAAQRRRTVVPTVVTYLYTTDIPALALELQLEPAGRVADVILAEPYDPVVFERTWTEEGWRFAALSQVTADLLTSGDRNPQAAVALMTWMEENEDAWRT